MDIQATYNGEEVETQAGVNLQAALGSRYGAAAISEAFDEPLTDAQVLDIAGLFIVVVVRFRSAAWTRARPLTREAGRVCLCAPR